MAALARIKRELEILATDPGPGVSAWPMEDDMMSLQAQIQGPSDSPFAEGTYTLSVNIPDRYPFEPPRVRFLTPIYHPNIDRDGRICLDTLKMQPQGSWSPSVNINTLLLTIRMLMQTPNADDGLVPEITEEYKRDVNLWHRKALEHTRKNAMPKLLEAPLQTDAQAVAEEKQEVPSVSVPVTVDSDSALGKRGRDDSVASDKEAALVEQSAGNGGDDEDEDDDDFYVT